MQPREDHLGVWISIAGAMLFIGVLFISAYWENDIRWLHFFQAWMYIAAASLIWLKNKWGLLIGFSTAAFWNYTTLFANSFLKSGIEQARFLLQSGHVARPDLFISVPGWIGNLLLILGCFTVYVGSTRRTWTDLLRLLIAFGGTTGFFALIMALFQPRYLALFRQCLHPRLQI